MTKLIGYTRVSQRLSADREVVDLLTADVDRDDLYVDHGGTGVGEARPQFHRALESLRRGDTFVITILGQLAQSREGVLHSAKDVQSRYAELRILSLDGRDVNTATPAGSLVCVEALVHVYARLTNEVSESVDSDQFDYRCGSVA